MGEFAERIKFSLKESLLEFLIFLVRLASGVFLGLTLAVTSEAIWHTGILVFMFIVVVTMGVIARITRYWGLLTSVILLLSLVLIGVLFKLYIHTAIVG
ncbi:MAG: hypothetical protein K2Q26_01105 [Bdellovibrionales bacterium]|nr:hypothetical protein [Bdellovibrionales bacterium]